MGKIITFLFLCGKLLLGDFMEQHNFKKKYGQNFLNDKIIINNITSSINPIEDDLIIEIGPGSGALTKNLVKYNSNLICYEVDTELKNTLENIANDKTILIFDDILNRDLKEDVSSIKYNKLYIIGNLPYYITTPIILSIIQSNIDVQEMVFMVQKEVADRFSSKPGTKEYGSISVLLNYYFDIKKLFNVSKNKFYPIPKVDSAVLKLVKKDTLLPVDLDKFNKIVKDAFQFKRKNLRNNLKDYDEDKISEILSKYGFNLNNRAEELSYEIFVELANNI